MMHYLLNWLRYRRWTPCRHPLLTEAWLRRPPIQVDTGPPSDWTLHPLLLCHACGIVMQREPEKGIFDGT